MEFLPFYGQFKNILSFDIYRLSTLGQIVVPLIPNMTRSESLSSDGSTKESLSKSTYDLLDMFPIVQNILCPIHIPQSSLLITSAKSFLHLCFNFRPSIRVDNVLSRSRNSLRDVKFLFTEFRIF